MYFKARTHVAHCQSRAKIHVSGHIGQSFKINEKTIHYIREI